MATMQRGAGGRPIYVVGREDEVRAFTASLGSPTPSVLCVVGHGGVGKTTLLRLFEAEAQQQGKVVTRVDAGDLPPLRPAFRAALVELVSGGSDVLLLDGFEAARGCEDVVADVLLAHARPTQRFVFAGRLGPSPALRALVQHGLVVDILPLADLTMEEAEEYLRRRAVPAEFRRALAARTHGHPLALALTADVHLSTGGHVDLDDHPDLVRELLVNFVRDVPDAAQLEALRVCALARTTTEEPLVPILSADAPRTFEWLRGLSFVQRATPGLAPHPLARDVLVAEFRWRNLTAFHATLQRLFEHHGRRIASGRAPPQREVLELAFLLRHSPALQSFMEVPAGTEAVLDVARPTDEPTLVAFARRHLGPATATLVSAWFSDQPEGFFVVRGRDGEVRAFAALLRLDHADPTLRARDPATAAAWAYATSRLERPGPVAYMRWMMARDELQPITPEIAMCWPVAAFAPMQVPDLAFCFQPFETEARTPMMVAAGVVRTPALAFTLDGRRIDVGVLDRRGRSPVEFVTSLARRAIELDLHGTDPSPAAPRGPAPELDESTFGGAVREALRALRDRRRLRKSPLLRARLVAEADTEDERLERLHTLLTQEIAALRGISRGDRTYLAAHAVFLDGTLSQEDAAARLGMADSTLRRHLHEAAQRIHGILWERERRAP